MKLAEIEPQQTSQQSPALEQPRRRASRSSSSEKWKIIRRLIDTPRWLLLGALVYAPWAYGCTRSWASDFLALLLNIVVVLWVTGCVLQRRRPAVPWAALAAVGCLLAQGWWMALNAKSVFDFDSLTLLPKTSLPNAPGSVDGSLSTSTMFLLTGLLGAMLFVSDLATRPAWRKRLWVTIACTGISIAFFGLIQKVGGVSVFAWVWEREKIDLNNNFALYRYRGNAGAYLNIVLPIIFALAVENFRKRDSQQLKTLWAAALVIVAAAIQLNPSRAGWGIALLMTLGVGTVWGWRLLKRARHNAADLWRYGAVAILFAVALGLISWFDWQSSWRRMNRQGISPAGRSPTEIYLAMVPDAGAFGFGPGTFRAAFPGYQSRYDFGGREVPEFWTKSYWPQAHQDYLQTLIEWGCVGALFWTILVGGGLWRGALHVKTMLAERPRSSRRDHDSRHTSHASTSSHLLLMCCTLLALLGILLHACIDFPLQIASLQLYVAVLLGICWRECDA